MVLGRIAHYAIDAILLSTVVAGVKRSTGFTCVLLPYYVPCPQPRKLSLLFLFSLDTEYISNPTVRSWTERYLGVGESMFNTLQGAVVTSPYFKRSERQ
jgi:hypothetical protein